MDSSLLDVSADIIIEDMDSSLKTWIVVTHFVHYNFNVKNELLLSY